LNEATTKLGPCQVRSNTESPCSRRAEVEILGVAFCVPCARQQEAYFSIGELTQEEAWSHRSKLRAEALKRMRQERTGGGEGSVAEVHDGLSDVDESVLLALRSG
jgi:hypothetical protein